MMKTIKFLFLSLLICFSVCSCEVTTYATTQDDVYAYNVEEVVIEPGFDFNVIVRYGRPYYYDGVLLYYLYNNLYYYPFWYDNYWYVRAYYRPFPYLHHRPYFRPHKHDFRFGPGVHRGFDRLDKHMYQRPAPNMRNGYGRSLEDRRQGGDMRNPGQGVRPDNRGGGQDRPGQVTPRSRVQDNNGRFGEGGSRSGRVTNTQQQRQTQPQTRTRTQTTTPSRSVQTPSRSTQSQTMPQSTSPSRSVGGSSTPARTSGGSFGGSRSGSTSGGSRGGGGGFGGSSRGGGRR